MQTPPTVPYGSYGYSQSNDYGNNSTASHATGNGYQPTAQPYVQKTFVAEAPQPKSAQAGAQSGTAPTKAASNRCCYIVTAAIVLAIVASAIIGVLVKKKNDSKDTFSRGFASPNTVYVTLQSNNMKAGAMAAAVDAFNNGKGVNNTLPGGQHVFINLKNVATTPLDTSLSPTLFSPATSFWLQADSTGLTSSKDQCVDLTSIPVGIAMWRKMATALGWPAKPISFKKIVALAQDPDGWASLGPQYAGWGKLKFGHGHLKMSNSGRLGTIAAIYGIVANQSLPQAVNITNRTIWDPLVREGINSLELHTYHLGRSDNELLDHMLDRGQGYLHAIMTYESTVIDYNRRHSDELQRKFGDDIVLIYPSDGTFWVENPICILDKAPWVFYNQIAGARLFLEYLSDQDNRMPFLAYGVRPLARGADYGGYESTILPQYGALPNMTVESVPLILQPSNVTMTEVVDMWYQEKKPSAVAVILDTSGSMADSGSMNIAKQNMAEFVRQLSNEDYLLPIAFSSDVRILHPMGRVGDIREETLTAIDSLFADGSTSLYKAVALGLRELNVLRANQTVDGVQPMNYALVVMTDGQDTEGGKETVMAALPTGEDPSQVHVYSVAYGNAVGQSGQFFDTISRQTNGRNFFAGYNNMTDVWFEISLEF